MDHLGPNQPRHTPCNQHGSSSVDLVRRMWLQEEDALCTKPPHGSMSSASLPFFSSSSRVISSVSPKLREAEAAAIGDERRQGWSRLAQRRKMMRSCRCGPLVAADREKDGRDAAAEGRTAPCIWWVIKIPLFSVRVLLEAQQRCMLHPISSILHLGVRLLISMGIFFWN